MTTSVTAPAPTPAHAPLTRSLTAPETWGFGVATHIACPIIVPSVHAALGTGAIFVWVPAIIVGMLINYQVKRLGLRWIDMAGGTSSYTMHLWQDRPWIARYVALSFFSAWLAAVPVYAIVLTDLIKSNLDTLNLPCPELLLRVGFTLLPLILAFSGIRALSLLHLFFIIPALGLLLLFCVQGLGWLVLSPESPGLFPERLTPPNFVDWAKWFFLVVWVTYSGESAAAFTAESKNPKETLRFLGIAAWLLVPVYLGGAWVVMRLANQPNLEGDNFLTLLAASQPFWGRAAGLIVTFWLAAICLLNNTTVVALCPRMLYQMAVEEQLAPVFAVVSRRGVFGPALAMMMGLSLIGLAWGDVSRLVVFGNVTWFFAMMMLHLGLWRQRQHPEVLAPRISLGLFGLEAVVLITAAIAWGWRDFAFGLLPPLGILAIDAMARRVPFPCFQPHWWRKRYHTQTRTAFDDSVMIQVLILIGLLSGAVLTGWWFGTQLHTQTGDGDNLVAILLMTVVFVGVAIACWTSLPQVIAIAEAQEATEHLFQVAQDGILVVDGRGRIDQANPATQSLFAVNEAALVGSDIGEWLPEFTQHPDQWAQRSEQFLGQGAQVQTLEVSVSDRPHQDFQEYMVILRDITKRKQAEQILQQSEAELRAQAQQLAAQLLQSEKMSSLGQLVAGIAHEINNPVGFIYSNLDHADEYMQGLLELLQLYQRYYPHPEAEIQAKAKAIDLNFLVEDLPELINSMKTGADRIQHIVGSLRGFSRKDESEIKTVDIHEGIESTLIILNHRLNATTQYPIQVIKTYGEIPLVECYAGQLNQVFMNILVNAVDALEAVLESDFPSGFIPTIHIQTQLAAAQQVRICIADNASGIPEAVQPHIFDPFFTTKPVGKGTGLGLSLSYDIIVHKHHGRLSCASAPGQGAKFILEIPIHQPFAQTPEPSFEL